MAETDRAGCAEGGYSMRSLWAAVVLSLFSALPASAAPCPGTVVLQDAFTSPNTSLDVAVYPQDKIAIQGGKAEITFQQSGSGRAEEYWGARFGDVNVCVTVSEPATDKAENQSAGVVFWGTDYNSYYTFQIQPGSGQYAVAEYTPGTSGSTWTFPVAWTANAAVVKTMGATNTLRVQTKGNTATLFVNDQQVGTVSGTPPSGGGQVGFYGGSSSTSMSTWDATNFSASVSQTSSASASAACPGTVMFQDPFATPDPLLNVQTSTGTQFTTKGGQGELTIQQASWGQMVEYAGQFGDANVCASFSAQPTDKAENQMAGVIFWAEDYNNAYLLEINATTGQFLIAEKSGGNWVMTVTSTPSTAIEKGMGKTNTLRVQTKGNTATLYINNQQVETLTGLARAGGGVVGFYAESETTYTTKETWNVANFTVALP
jgi:hypothetical protein